MEIIFGDGVAAAFRAAIHEFLERASERSALAADQRAARCKINRLPSLGGWDLFDLTITFKDGVVKEFAIVYKDIPDARLNVPNFMADVRQLAR
jgi:hypothetical protein